MKGAITSEAYRSTGQVVTFEVDELNLDLEGERVVTKNFALDGTTITTNWGYPEGSLVFAVNNVVISRSDYSTLVSMKEDDDYDFLFHYKNSTWKIVLQGVSGVEIGNSQVLASLTLSIIEKYTDGETS